MTRGRWTMVLLAAYFVLFLLFLYGPLLVMAVLSLQGPLGGITFPMKGFSFDWWEALVNGPRADAIRETALRSLRLGVVAGAIVALLAFSLSMAYRRRFRGDGVLFYLVMLALMTPGFLLSLGTSLYWQFLEQIPDLWRTALGTNVVWGLPFGFLVMIAIWNRYDRSVEEAARDLGAGPGRTFREVTLPLVWTGLFGSFLFGFTLSWNEYDRTALVLSSGEATLPIQIFALTVGSVIRPDLYALGTATTIVSLLAVGIFLVVAGIWIRRRGLRAEAREEAALARVDLAEVVPELSPTDAAPDRAS
jgi:putative spermidine/putrescine transport system permease protein